MRPLAVRSALFRPASASLLPSIQRVPRQARCQSTTSNTPATASLSPRWLSDVKSRIGKCIMFGIGHEQTQEAGSILQEIAGEWRELLAGSEGFLTGKEYRGLYRQEVVWGEMVSFLLPPQYSCATANAEGLGCTQDSMVRQHIFCLTGFN